MGSGGGYLVEFSPGLEEEYTGYLEVLETEEEQQLLTGNTPINIGILSGLLALGLTTNLLAFPVILFKRTRSVFLLLSQFFSLSLSVLIFFELQVWERSVCSSGPRSHHGRPSHNPRRARWWPYSRGCPKY